jgi:hypothetical protein
VEDTAGNLELAEDHSLQDEVIDDQEKTIENLDQQETLVTDHHTKKRNSQIENHHDLRLQLETHEQNQEKKHLKNKN